VFCAQHKFACIAVAAVHTDTNWVSYESVSVIIFAKCLFNFIRDFHWKHAAQQSSSITVCVLCLYK